MSQPPGRDIIVKNNFPFLTSGTSKRNTLTAELIVALQDLKLEPRILNLRTQNEFLGLGIQILTKSESRDFYW